MTDKQYMTIVIEYDAAESMPAIHANQHVLGGKITGMAWNDVIAELHNKEERLAIFETVIRKFGFEDEVDELVEELSEI